MRILRFLPINEKVRKIPLFDSGWWQAASDYNTKFSLELSLAIHRLVSAVRLSPSPLTSVPANFR